MFHQTMAKANRGGGNSGKSVNALTPSPGYSGPVRLRSPLAYDAHMAARIAEHKA